MQRRKEVEEESSVGSTYSEWHSDRSDIVEQQLDPSRTIAEIKALLLGTTFGQDDKGEWYIGIPDEKKRVFTDEGVNAIISYLEPLLSTQVVLSNLKEDEARERARSFEINIAYNMTINWNKWFSRRYTENPSLIEPIHDRIKLTMGILVYSHLTRAIGGLTHQGIVDMSKRIEQVIQREDYPQSIGLLDKLKNRFR